MPSVTVTISDEDWQSIVEALDGQDREPDVCRRFAEVAVENLAAWIAGRRRYRSLTEQYADWISALYVAILPVSEAPSFRRLYNNFNLPYGQANYIARTLMDKSLRQWRDLAQRELVAAVKKVEQGAREFIANQDGDQVLAVRISKLANTELIRYCDQLSASDPNFLAPRPRGGYGDNRQVEIPARTVVQLIDRFEAHR